MAHPDFFQGGRLPTLPPRAGAPVSDPLIPRLLEQPRTKSLLRGYAPSSGCLMNSQSVDVGREMT